MFTDYNLIPFVQARFCSWSDVTPCWGPDSGSEWTTSRGSLYSRHWKPYCLLSWCYTGKKSLASSIILRHSHQCLLESALRNAVILSYLAIYIYTVYSGRGIAGNEQNLNVDKWELKYWAKFCSPNFSLSLCFLLNSLFLPQLTIEHDPEQVSMRRQSFPFVSPCRTSSPVHGQQQKEGEPLPVHIWAVLH